MTYFVIPGYNSGQPINAVGVEEKALVSLGFHGYGTAAQATAHPNAAPNIVQAAALPGIISGQNPVTAGTGGPQNPNASAAAPVGSSIPNPLTGLEAIGGFFASLSEPHLWWRVAKVVIGGVLLLVGLAKITGADKKIGGLAAKAVKVAPLL